MYLGAEKPGNLKKLENPVQNTSFESIVGARPPPHHATAERDNAPGIMTIG